MEISKHISEKRIALVGKPNSGKSALFNALTGARQKVANYPGVTVERKEGMFQVDGNSIRLIDLPGTYSLQADSLDERVTCSMLAGKIDGVAAPDIVICVVDATNLRLSLRLALEAIALGLPIIVALNKTDIAQRRGYKISVEALSKELGVQVIPTIATQQDTMQELLQCLASPIDAPRPTANPCEPHDYSKRIKRILSVAQLERGKRDKLTGAIDSVLLHPFFGPIFFLVLIFLMFQAVFNFASMPMDIIDHSMSWLIDLVNYSLPDGLLKSLLGDGVIAGVGSVLIFIPQIVILFFFILVLEESGYMARAAFLLDRLMGGVGLHGKAFIPLLSSFACAIPGIMATRTIESHRDRLVTILIAPLMTCSARLPVYTLVIAAFIPNTLIWGAFRLQGIVMFGLYAAGVISAMLVAFVLRKFLLKGRRSPLLLEMPDYNLPHIRNLSIGLLERVRIFIRRAGKIILPLMILVWFLSTFPKAPDGITEPAILYSFAGIIGKAVAPIFAPIGFNWQMVVALIPGLAAREVAVGVLGTVYAISSDAGSGSLGDILAMQWSLPTALSFLTWYIFAPQCLPTLGVTKRETNSWKWPTVMLVYMAALAYICSYIVFNFSTYLGL